MKSKVLKTIAGVLLVCLTLSVVAACSQSAPQTTAPSAPTTTAPATSASPKPTASPSPTASTPVKAIKWDLATLTSPTSYNELYTGVDRFAQVIKERAGGRLEIVVHPGGTLFQQNEFPTAISTGAVQVVFQVGAVMSALVPEVGLLDIPFLITDQSTYFKVMEGPFGQSIAKLFAAKNTVPLYWDNYGFRAIDTVKKPVLKLEDLKGMKLRVLASALITKSWQAWGAQPVSIGAGEQATALQTGVIDGLDGYPTGIYTGGLSELVRFITTSNHSTSPWNAFVNKQAFDALPADLQQIVRDAGKEAALYRLSKQQGFDDNALQKMKASGMTFNDMAQSERDRFRTALKAVYDEALQKYGDPAKTLYGELGIK